MGRPGGQSRCTTVCVVTVLMGGNITGFPCSLVVLPAGLSGAGAGGRGGGGVGALLGPEGTGPASRPSFLPGLPGGWGCVGAGVVVSVAVGAWRPDRPACSRGVFPPGGVVGVCWPGAGARGRGVFVNWIVDASI